MEPLMWTDDCPFSLQDSCNSPHFQGQVQVWSRVGMKTRQTGLVRGIPCLVPRQPDLPNISKAFGPLDWARCAMCLEQDERGLSWGPSEGVWDHLRPEFMETTAGFICRNSELQWHSCLFVSDRAAA